QAAHVIRMHPQHHVVIGVYSLGKETLLADLAVEFRTWVVVSPRRLEQMRLVGGPRCTLGGWNMLHPTIALLPTGRPVKVTHPNIHLIPYSDHSSFAELCEFVKWLKPCSVIPIVKGGMCQSFFQKYLSSVPQALPDFKLPKPVQEPPQQQSKRTRQEPVCLLQRTARHSVPRGVVYESPEESTEESEELGGGQVPEQSCCESAFCLKECCTCHRGREKEKEELGGEQPGVARAANAISQAPFSDEHFPTGFAEQYLLTPLNILKQNSSQKFDRLVEDFFRRGEAS
ncbi:5' exonuclease Apollo, partial [Colius striatus]